ncbi:65_t:CDS:2, partial [Entrophospora sp. SA101]
MDQSFCNREFSYTLRSGVYIRYCSYNNIEEFKSDISKKCPAKIDIGAIYTTRPADKKTSKPSEFKPIKKEVVFDIDLKDYDDIRTYTVNQYFDDLILKDQDVLKDESCWNKVLGCIPNEETRNTLKNRWSENPSQTSWIDRNIWVCVPIPPETCDDFNPLNVPTIKSLKELDRFGKEKSMIVGYEKISLNSHIEYFEHFVQNIEAGKRDKLVALFIGFYLKKKGKKNYLLEKQTTH